MSRNTEIFDGRFLGLSQSGKAAKFLIDDDYYWLPCSQIEFDWRANEGDPVDVEVPEWLAIEKGLL